MMTNEELEALKLAPDHKGMRVDYSGLLGQSVNVLKRSDPANAEMLRQLSEHMTELGKRFYSGDISVVDEFLQLYCVETKLREKLKGSDK
ncbi:hypothetical protein ACO0K2_18010 [Undibacterium sp. MH2W]|uniref:hypothetical protein n=1 Tax=Undibacterium sp. MH2W TaxID=3413044 RepID=UPI003BF24F60